MLIGYECTPAPEGPFDGFGRKIGLFSRHVHGGDPGEPVLVRLLSIYYPSDGGPGLFSAHWKRKKPIGDVIVDLKCVVLLSFLEMAEVL